MVLGLLLCFTLKHFIFDFLYQPPYQWQNKGTYGHWGGIVHSSQHVAASYVILLCFGIDIRVIAVAIVFEFVVHYHMDWFKMRHNAKKEWKCNTHNEFWILTGIDQMVHYLTYLAMVWYIAASYD